MLLFRPNRVVLQPIFYMFTRCMLCMEKSIETMEKSIETMDNSMKTLEKSMKPFGKSMNTMEKWTKTMEKAMNSAAWQILAPKFDKEAFAPKCSK